MRTKTNVFKSDNGMCVDAKVVEGNIMISSNYTHLSPKDTLEFAYQLNEIARGLLENEFFTKEEVKQVLASRGSNPELAYSFTKDMTQDEIYQALVLLRDKVRMLKRRRYK